jgi:hypothetical protein
VREAIPIKTRGRGTAAVREVIRLIDHDEIGRETLEQIRVFIERQGLARNEYGWSPR